VEALVQEWWSRGEVMIALESELALLEAARGEEARRRAQAEVQRHPPSRHRRVMRTVPLSTDRLRRECVNNSGVITHRTLLSAIRRGIGVFLGMPAKQVVTPNLPTLSPKP